MHGFSLTDSTKKRKRLKLLDLDAKDLDKENR